MFKANYNFKGPFFLFDFVEFLTMEGTHHQPLLGKEVQVTANGSGKDQNKNPIKP